jgi:hypothetical protein
MSVQRIHLGIILALAMIGMVASVVAIGLYSYQIVPTNGRVRTVGVNVFWYSNCTGAVTNIDWSLLEPGGSKNVTVYIQNNGTAPISLNMTTENWTPGSASSKMALSWNVENHVVAPDSFVQAVLSLSVSPDISGIDEFTFDIVIYGRETP